MNAELPESPFRRFWSWISKPPDEILADAARDGELMVARLRVFITVFLTVSPVVGLLLGRDPTTNWIGLGIALVFIVVALILAAVVNRTPYSAQVSMISAITDVSLRTARNNSALVIGMLDVDHFKLFNDTHGHAAGDAALKHVASALRGMLRRSDLIARYGGEEFLIVLPGTGTTRGREKLTVSIGAAAWDDDGKTVAELLDVADARLYAAKNAGRNRVVGP